MKRAMHRLNQIGIDGVVILLLSLVGILFSIYDFVGGNELSPRIVVGVLCLLVLESVFQRIRLGDVKDELTNLIKGINCRLIEYRKDFEYQRRALIISAEHFIYETELCYPPRHFPFSESSTTKLLNERIANQEISYKFIIVVYDRSHFEFILYKLFRLYKYDYYIGYFMGALELIPTINLMIVDDKRFLLGGYYGPTLRGDDKYLYIQHDEAMATVFREYFEYLWSKAHLLNENGQINWDEIKRCGLALGYTLDELNTTISYVAQKADFSEVNLLA